jgi:hypothetical protein
VVQAQVVRAITGSKDPQLRQSLASVLIVDAAQLGKNEPEIRKWLDSKEPALRQLGLRILLRRRAALADASINEALGDGSANLESDAMQYVRQPSLGLRLGIRLRGAVVEKAGDGPRLLPELSRARGRLGAP